MLNRTCHYVTKWADRVKYCDEVDRLAGVETYIIIGKMRDDHCTSYEISMVIDGRTEALQQKRQHYYERLTYKIDNLKKKSLKYFLTVVMKIR